MAATSLKGKFLELIAFAVIDNGIEGVDFGYALDRLCLREAHAERSRGKAPVKTGLGAGCKQHQHCSEGQNIESLCHSLI